jgi:hypothetical protein
VRGTLAKSGTVTSYDEGMETSREETQVPEPSALPDVIRCAEHECGASVANYSRNADTDEVTVRNLRRSGWGVVAGQWACRDHGAEDSYPRNVFCGRRERPPVSYMTAGITDGEVETWTYTS